MDRRHPANALAQPHTLVGAPSAFDAPHRSPVPTNADVAFRCSSGVSPSPLADLHTSNQDWGGGWTRAVQVLMLGLHMRLPPAKRLAHAHMIARAARERTSSISQCLCLLLHLPPRRVFRALNSPGCLVAFFAEAVSLSHCWSWSCLVAICCRRSRHAQDTSTDHRLALIPASTRVSLRLA
jgi:hypothetical protein